MTGAIAEAIRALASPFGFTFDPVVRRDFTIAPGMEEPVVKRAYVGWLWMLTFTCDRPELVLKLRFNIRETAFEFERSVQDLYDEGLLGYNPKLPWLASSDSAYVVCFTPPGDGMPFEECYVGLRNPTADKTITVSEFECLLLRRVV